MKTFLVAASMLFISCASVEDRIKEYSYTDMWHYENGHRYQVYQTKKGDLYIITLNKRETNYKRKYIKVK